MVNKYLLTSLSVILILSIITFNLYKENNNLNEDISFLTEYNKELKDNFYKVSEEKSIILSNYSEVKEQLTKNKQLLSAVTEENQEFAKQSLIDFEPEFKTVEKILRKDLTNTMEYHIDDFNCVDFSNMLVKSLTTRGIFACSTYLEFDKDSAHSIVAVRTIDKGVIYIEPQDDKILYELELGDDYCDKVDWNCKWKITKIRSCFD